MIYIDAEHLQDGLYNIKDGEIYKYKAKGGTVRTYELRNVVTCGECKMWINEHLCQWWSRYGTVETDADDFCSYGEREGE